jgi:exodeoxyribonuclease V gamma subunit
MANAFQSGFMVFHGNRLEDLRDLTVGLFKNNPLPPLVPETLLVQSNGMKHWLEMALADDAAMGICAATHMELPSSFIWRIYRLVLGQALVPVAMPFDKQALVWRLWRLLPEFAKTHQVEALLAYVKDDPLGRQRFQLAQQVADVFDGYQSYRADWLSDWAQGRYVLQHQSESKAMPPDQIWQAQLWQLLLQDVMQKQAPELASQCHSRAEVHSQFMRKLEHAESHKPEGLPPRIVVFGISNLPMQVVEALAALGRWSQIILMVQNPCQEYWGHDMDLLAQKHSLLSSWGQQGRDYLHALERFDQPENALSVMSKQTFFVDPAEHSRPTRLQKIQSDILKLNAMPSLPESCDDDGSIQMVQAHSAQREVDILHDRLWAWFDENPTWKPNDVMVMVPDMATFASHIQAVFGRFGPQHPRFIPFSVADTTPRQVPMVQALEFLLKLPEARVTLTEWLSLFEVSAVRAKFQMTEPDVQTMKDWLQAAAVRWGLNPAHRQKWGVPSSMPNAQQNTWSYGLQRLILGYAAGQAEGVSAWHGVLPLPQVSGLSALKVGYLAQWLEAVSLTLTQLNAEHTPAQWCSVMHDVLLRFFEVDNESDERMLLRLQQELSHWQSLCDQAGMAEPIPLTVVREHWLSGLESSGLQQRFFGGGVQFSTLMPMRAIPFKGLCLLGMNDGAYPRQSTPRDFDLMSFHWRAGDRSRREDDRYLFLEAFLSAREKLYISWQGRRSTDNQKMPPSVLVSQLRDTLKSRFTPETSAVLQPLQAFSAKYFLPQSEFLTYADDWEKAQQYSIVSNKPSAEPESSALAFPAISEWPLKECMRLLKQPVEVYWRSRLGVQLNGPEEALLEDENFVLDGLGRYSLGRSLLEAPNIDEQLEAEKLIGQLPMGAAGQMLLKQQYDAAQKVKERASAYWLEYAHELPTQTIAVDVAMPWGKVQVTAEVSALRQSLSPANHSIDLDHFAQAAPNPPTLQISTRPGAVATGHRDQQSARADILIQLWPQHVLLSAAGWNIQSVLVGLDGVTVLQPLSEQSAQKLLTQWLMVYAQSWTQPLPVSFKAGLAFVTEQISLQGASQGGLNEGSAVTSDVLSQDGITELALEKARKEFSDDFSESTDLARSLYVQRSFDHFDAIAEGLPIWAPLLYEGLIHAAAMEGDAA